MKGRKPKTARPPHSLKAIQVGLERRSCNREIAAQPKAARGLPPCPPHLTDRARAAWNFWREALEAHADRLPTRRHDARGSLRELRSGRPSRSNPHAWLPSRDRKCCILFGGQQLEVPYCSGLLRSKNQNWRSDASCCRKPGHITYL